MTKGAGIRFKDPYRESISENFDNLSKGSLEPVSDSSVAVDILGMRFGCAKLQSH